MRRLKTLRIRFALWIAAVLAAAFMLFGLFVYVNMSRRLKSAVDETLYLASHQLTTSIAIHNDAPVPIENPIAGPQYAGLDDQGFSMRILNLQGQSIQEDGPYRNWPLPQIAFTDPRHPGDYQTITDAVSGDRVRIYSAPIAERQHIVGTVQVGQNLDDVREILNLLVATLLLGMPLTAIVVGSSGYFLAARALDPIDKITRTAREISANDLSARLSLPETDDEVGRLAATFDSMLGRLSSAFQRQHQFTADASHELRTPLAAMQTIISSISVRQRSPAEYQQAMNDLREEVDRMRGLTEGLLQLARQDSGQQSARFEDVDLALVLADVVESLRPLAEDKHLKLIDHVEVDGLIVSGDRDGLIRIFVNLVDNAIKYTEQGCIIVIATATDDRSAEVIISDTGIGVAPQHIPHIFDRFYRVDEARSKDGIGLGLAIVHDIVRAHHASISVDSTAGRGTTVTVKFTIVA